MRTTLKAIVIGILASAALALGAMPARAQDDPPSDEPAVAPVDVLQVDGFIDPVVVAEITNAVDDLATNGSQALILQVNSRGVVVDDDTFTELLSTIADASRPVAVWVGPSGARLLGAAVHLLAVADVSGMAPGAEVGYLDTSIINPVAATDPAAVDALDALIGRSVGLTDARTLGVFRQRISDEGIATIANMLDALDGYEGEGVVLETTEEEITEDGTVQRTTTAVPRFSKPGLVDQLFHTVASPPVAYLLLLVGLGLLLFEFFTAGVGVAAVVGIASTLLSAYGLDVLPARGWAVALLVGATVAFAIDVQVGLPRAWTGIGITSTIVGSLWLFEPLPGTSLRPSWLTLIVGIGGGKTLDTAKSVASRLNIQVVIVPTIAASDAPCSALSVFYDNDGRVAFDEFLHRNPDLVLVDTEIIAQAPSRFLAAGIGDALATYYEAQACRRSGAANCMAVPGAAVAYAIARECREILFEHGREALADNDRQRVSHDLEQVIEANILLSGVGFESGGVAAAHAIHHGLAEMPETHHYLHGEKVALGILVGLILEQATQEFETVRDFLGQVRLPTSLSALGLHDVTDAQLQSIAARACREGEIMHNEPMPVTQADVVAALKQL